MLISLLGYCTLIAFAWLCSASRKDINWRTVFAAVAIQFGFGVLVLYVPAGKASLEWLSNGSQLALDWLSIGSRLALDWLSKALQWLSIGSRWLSIGLWLMK